MTLRTRSLLLIPAFLGLFSAGVLADDAGVPPDRAKWCAENPRKCEEAKKRFEAKCAQDPARCERIKARMAEWKAKCEADPQACEKKREEMRARRAERKAWCEANPEECKAKREAYRERRNP